MTDSIPHALQHASTLEELFDYASAPTHSPTLMARHLKARLAALREATSPRDSARLDQLAHHHAQALSALERGELGKGLALTLPSRYAQGERVEIAGKSVVLEALLTSQDMFCRAHCTIDGFDGVAHMVWSNSASDDERIERASQAIRTMFEDDAPQHKHLPRLLCSGRTSEGHRAMVLDDRTRPTLADTLARHPELSHPEHMVWILRRTLSALGWAHKNGIVHGHITPDTLRLRTSNHNVWIHDWEHACVAPARTGQGFIHSDPEFSPPEVHQQLAPLPSSDLYALGRTMQWLLRGGQSHGELPEDCPEEWVRLLRFMTLQSPTGRARDAWQLYHEVERIRRHLYGPHHFKQIDSSHALDQ